MFTVTENKEEEFTEQCKHKMENQRKCMKKENFFFTIIIIFGMRRFPRIVTLLKIVAADVSQSTRCHDDKILLKIHIGDF